MFDVIFFFFNQKTAYELRISDWSSDVCSSDLCCRERWRFNGEDHQVLSTELFWIVSYPCRRSNCFVGRDETPAMSPYCLQGSTPGQGTDMSKIGRGSCRERANNKRRIEGRAVL